MDGTRGFSDLLKQGVSMMSSDSEGGNHNHNHHHNNNNNNSSNNNNGDAGSKSDFLHSAAASLFSSSSSHSSTATSHADSANFHVGEGQPGKKPHPSTGEVLSSAQVVFHAVKAKVGKKDDGPSEEIPAGKVAGAAANLLGAAAHYGKLDEAKYGKVIHKAEDYLHKYESKHSTGSGGAGGGGHHGN